MKKCISIIKLTALLVLAPVTIYVMSVSDTVKLYKEYRQAKESMWQMEWMNLLHLLRCSAAVS